MKILIFGSNGWIGGQCIDLLKKQNIEYIQSTSRADCEKDVVEEINTHNPTHVMSLIGRTHGKIGDKVYPTIDYLENKGKLVDNIRDNLY